mmetsp:Transcript_6038/g.10723  ORF Transcript_6038/g.10723 Transcript_6038/m.10723 type:complete len:316 (+) Transcript_6038:55-1002(+)
MMGFVFSVLRVGWNPSILSRSRIHKSCTSVLRMIHSRSGSRANTLIQLDSKTAVLPVPILNDNYSYLLIDTVEKTAAAVDPAEPEKLIQAAESQNVKISSILTTHHHWDHAGGNVKMVQMLGNDIEVVGSAVDPIPKITVRMNDGDTHRIRNTQLSIRAMASPCHTRGHVMFYVDVQDSAATTDVIKGILFSGDTLFIAGCGRFFEGDANDMQKVMARIRSEFPKETAVFCGHEYTVGNLKFAKSIEPQNEAVEEKLNWAVQKLAKNEFTVPSVLAEELKYNPFLRTNSDSIQKATGLVDPVQVMSKLRSLKNNF